MMTFVPSALNSLVIMAPAPWPIDTMIVTAAMPMTMPSTVNSERILFLLS